MQTVGKVVGLAGCISLLGFTLALWVYYTTAALNRGDWYILLIPFLFTFGWAGVGVIWGLFEDENPSDPKPPDRLDTIA